MEMQRVNSRAIQAIGYDPVSWRLRIRFEKGDTYDFCGVPSDLYERFMRAPSKGSFYNDHIRDRYQC